MHTNAEALRVFFDLGMWDQIVGMADDLLSWSETHHESQVEANALLGRADILVYRGNYRDPAALQNRLLELGRQIEDLQVLVPSLALSALIEQSQGHLSDAVDLIGELDRASRDHIPYRARHLPTAVRVLVGAGEVTRAEAFISDMEVAALRDRNSLLTGWAVVAEANQDHQQAIELYDDAAQRWAEFGFVLEHAQALLGAARCTLATGRRADVSARLHRAREIFSRLGARPLIDEVDAHLHSATALSS
jgi:tetratricopeptide (TPR) repeat protein